MRDLLALRTFAALLLSAALAYVVYDRDGTERLEQGGTQRYVGYISCILLPTAVVTLAVCAFLAYDAQTAAEMTLSFCFGVFLHICLYYLLLMPALPFLRRRISARACAMLWMLPNYLYLTQVNYMRLPAPRWVIQVSSGLARGLFWLWLAGFLAVLGWKTGSHLVFRTRILKRAVPVTDPAVLEVWQREVEAARFRRPRFRLVVSPDVRTPLSIGLFRRSVRVVLPERDYTPQELALLFRHELIHIGREDSQNKFFLVFCTAMCWFNPLMWAAMGRSAEDLELSCDETVLLGAGDGLRRQYANLLLRTAGDERGFTTCLSASAGALRYRLRHVMEPERRRSGALAVGLVFFLLIMSCGYTALAYGSETGAEWIYQSQDPADFVLVRAEWNDKPYSAVQVCTDQESLRRYLSALPMERVEGNYFFETEGRSLSLRFDTPNGPLFLDLSDSFAQLTPLYDEHRGRHYQGYFYLPGGVDWALLERCITECPALSLFLSGGNIEVDSAEVGALLRRAERNGQVIYEDSAPPEQIWDLTPDRAELSFTLPLDGACTVEISPLRGGGVQTAVLDSGSLILPLAEDPSLYTVRGQFRGKDGALFQAEFRFAVRG